MGLPGPARPAAGRVNDPPALLFLCVMATVLITGGSGLIGTHLTRSLLAQGHDVRHLGRRPGERPDGVFTHHWDPQHGVLDERALEGVDHLIHLAGAGIADKRWTGVRVRELIASRADTASLLLHAAQRMGVRPRSFISAAGLNYFGAITTDRIHEEQDPPAGDTIGRISVAWENAVDPWRSLCRVVKLRTPIVLARDGGALPRLALPVRWGLGAPLGHGRQWMPWVHIDDAVAIYLHAIHNDAMEGPYHVNASDQPDNRTFTRTLAQVLKRPFLLPPVPAVILRMALGELAGLLLEGSRASNARLLSTGYTFRFPRLDDALRDLLRR